MDVGDADEAEVEEEEGAEAEAAGEALRAWPPIICRPSLYQIRKFLFFATQTKDTTPTRSQSF